MPLSDGPITAEPYTGESASDNAAAKATGQDESANKPSMLDKVKSMLGLGGSALSKSSEQQRRDQGGSVQPRIVSSSATAPVAVRATGNSYLPPSTGARVRVAGSGQSSQLADSVVTGVSSANATAAPGAADSQSYAGVSSGAHPSMRTGDGGVPPELTDVMAQLYRALYDTPFGEVSSVLDAQALLNRMRQEIGMPLTGDASAAGVLRAAREAAEAVGC